jgi:hypothetical protein
VLLKRQRWSLDFVSDQMTDGRRFRILMTVIDNCTRSKSLVVVRRAATWCPSA